MKLVQQNPECSDFDVIFNESEGPSFRVILPETIKANEYKEYGGTHNIPGKWKRSSNGIEGSYRLKDDFEFSVAIAGEDGEIQVELGVKNLLDRILHDVTVLICANLNHLPGNPGWCNRDFLPNLELDRDVQGKFWYEKVTPDGLFALTNSGRVMMHRHRDNPDPELAPQYDFTLSDKPNAYACIARNVDGNRTFYQAWNRDCYWMVPFRGNACMHLIPIVARELKPGEVSTMSGIVGIVKGSEEDAVSRIERFKRETMNS